MKRFQNGSGDTSVRSASTIRTASFIHSDMASKTRCARGGVNEDVNDALTGHGGGNPIAREYGWDDMVRRFGFATLNAAVEKTEYPGLDLSALRWTSPSTSKLSR